MLLIAVITGVATQIIIYGDYMNLNRYKFTIQYTNDVIREFEFDLSIEVKDYYYQELLNTVTIKNVHVELMGVN